MKKNISATITLLFIFLLISCSTQKKLGTLVFTANGEDFVKQGFVDKDGWQISFDRIYVNIVNPTAYNKGLLAGLKKAYLVDLALGDKNAAPIKIDTIEKIKPGNYQSLKFDIRRVTDGPYKGFSIIMKGIASKNGEKVPFAIKLDEEMMFNGKEGYVGDVIKGIVKPGKKSEVEITFHFDHIFGDKAAPMDDHINTGSVGFNYFYQFQTNGAVDISQKELSHTVQYKTLIHAIWTLGHLGEGHCEVNNQSSKGI